MKIVRIDQIPFEMPFHNIPDNYMSWMRPQWRYFELVEVELESGHIGHGETMLFYTWGKSTSADADSALGKNAADLLWDDSLGSGIQMAVFDAVGKALDIPIHALLGDKVRDHVPLSWWATDMNGEDWVSECERAIEAGYTNIKLKARPWWDLRASVEQLSKNLPDSITIDLDFNGTLLNSDQAIPLLQELIQYPQIGVIETPIPQSDVEGNKAIRDAIDVDLAMHYGSPPVFDQSPPPLTAVSEDVCDGFVLTGGCKQLMEEGAVAKMADKPVWLQLVGTGITAAFTMHLGAVLESATWPAVTCHQLHKTSVLNNSITVQDGTAEVPTGPGLGVEVHSGTIESQRINESEAEPDPSRLIKTQFPERPAMYFANYEPQMKGYAQQGEFPYFLPGVETKNMPDDGSEDWQKIHAQALASPPVIRDQYSTEHN